MKDKLRGHKIEKINKKWVYSDTKQPTAGTIRECGQCGMSNTKEGHDGCLGTLPGLMNACCGHGDTREAYVQFLDGSVIGGADAVTIQDIIRLR